MLYGSFIGFRVDPITRELIEDAANEDGQTVSEFIRGASRREARRRLAETCATEREEVGDIES